MGRVILTQLAVVSRTKPGFTVGMLWFRLFEKSLDGLLLWQPNESDVASRKGSSCNTSPRNPKSLDMCAVFMGLTSSLLTPSLWHWIIGVDSGILDLSKFKSALILTVANAPSFSIFSWNQQESSSYPLRLSFTGKPALALIFCLWDSKYPSIQIAFFFEEKKGRALILESYLLSFILRVPLLWIHTLQSLSAWSNIRTSSTD